MTGDLERLEAKIDALAERLRRVEEEVFPGEESPSFLTRDREAKGTAGAAASAGAKEGLRPAKFLSFAGRSLIVLGGAFLLRWFTQSNILPQEIGSVIGVAYALLWIAMADITAGRGRRNSPAFHGVTGALIALPLLVEATTKFHFLSPASSAISLFIFVVLGLVVAGRRNLRILAWIVALPAAPVAFLLASRTQTLTPFLVTLLALGFVTLWLGYLRRWQFLAILMACAANLGLALVVFEQIYRPETAQGQLMGYREAIFLLVGLIAVYFGSFCFRVFRRKRTITVMEITQTLVVVLIGLGGIAAVLNAREHSMIPLGIVCLVLSLISYTAAFVFLPRRDPNRRNFLFYTYLALAMMLLGCELTLEAQGGALAFTVIALIAGVLSKPIASPILYLHGAAYLVAAMFRSGLFTTMTHAFVGPSASFGEWGSTAVLFALAVAILYPWLPKPLWRTVDVFLGRRASDLFFFVAVLGLGGIVVSLFTTFVPRGSAPETLRGALASTRTGVLAISAIALAWCNCKRHFRGLTWLVYAILVLGAIKLVFEDLAVGGASNLFLSLGLFGGALILGPRFLLKAEDRKSEL